MQKTTFVVLFFAYMSQHTLPASVISCNTIELESSDNGYTELNLDNGQSESVTSMTVEVQMSSSDCTSGSSYGYKDDTIIWADLGCRADFRVCTAGEEEKFFYDTKAAGGMEVLIFSHCRLQ